MNRLHHLLEKGNLNSQGKTQEVIDSIQSQNDFDEIFRLLSADNPKIVMRASDVLEKVSRKHQDWLISHKNELFHYLHTTKNKIFKFHLCLLVVRLPLNEEETGLLWQYFAQTALDKKESKIVRVNCIEGMASILEKFPELKTDFNLIIREAEREKIPSINARIRIIEKRFLRKG